MNSRRLAIALVLAVSIASAAVAAGGNLVANGGFEASGPVAAWTSLSAGSTAVPGWRVSSGTAALVGRYWAANSGTNSMEVGSPGGGSVEQTLRTVPGRAYRLSFALAGNPEGPPRVKTLEVTAGATARRFTFDSAGRTRRAMGWTPETLDFVAAGNSTTIRFARLDGGRSAWYGPVIDDVSVTETGGAAVPVPTAAPATARPATAPPATARPATAVPAPRATAAPVRTSAPRAYAPSGADPYSGVWIAAYPGKSLRVYLDHHGREVSGHAVDGNAAIPPGAIAFTGRVDHVPIVVLGKCTDADARGWHGAVIEWQGADTFRLHIANCHAGEVLYTRLRAQ